MSDAFLVVKCNRKQDKQSREMAQKVEAYVAYRNLDLLPDTGEALEHCIWSVLLNITVTFHPHQIKSKILASEGASPAKEEEGVGDVAHC